MDKREEKERLETILEKPLDAGESRDASFAMELLENLKVSNRRLFILCVALLAILLAREGMHMYERLQYDYASYDYSVDAPDGGNASFIGGDGDVNIGTGKSTD